MIYVAIAIAQVVDPLRIAIVGLCLGVIWKTVAVRHRLPAVAISVTILAMLLSAYIEIKRVLQVSPIPIEFASEVGIFVMVTLAGLVANIAIAAVVLGCGKLFCAAYREALQSHW